MDQVGAALLMLAAIVLWWRMTRSPRSPDRDVAEDPLRNAAARLKALEEPRPARAPVVGAPDLLPLEGTFEVPARATVFPKLNAALHGKMLAFQAHRSPAGEALALQLQAPRVTSAVVFDAKSRDVLWEPEGAVALLFRARASEAVTVEHVHRARPELRRRGGVEVVTPLQAEITWSLTRWRWPARERIAERGLSFPQGWAHMLVLSPDEKRLCVQFVDQTEAGWIVIDVEAEGMPRHAPQFQRRTNLVDAPVISPDGRWVACAATADFDWWLPKRPDAARAISSRNYDAFAAEQRAQRARGASGGVVRAGWVFVQDLATDETAEHELTIDLPAGWGGERSEDDTAPVGALRFIDADALEVTMQDGSTRTLPVR